jgi:hypothetical protein
MRWACRALIGACAALVLVACGGSDAGSSTTVPLVVKWGDYEPGLQAKIDAMAVAKDCAGMQLEFNEIGGTNLAVRTKFGHGNEEILKYIDDKERAIDCFPATQDPTSST